MKFRRALLMTALSLGLAGCATYPMYSQVGGGYYDRGYAGVGYGGYGAPAYGYYSAPAYGYGYPAYGYGY